MEKRNHHRTEITDVWPRKQWTKLKGRNQKLVMGYLVALTSKIRKGNEFKKQRNEPTQEMWWGIRVSIKEIATFLQKKTNTKYSVCRVATHRVLNYLNEIGYILIYDERKITPDAVASLKKDQYTTMKAMEVLWDDNKDVRAFFTPRYPELSKSGVSFGDNQVYHSEQSGVTQVYHLTPSGVTFQNPNVTPDNEEYGSTKPQNAQNEGASINNILLITQNTEAPATSDGARTFSLPSKDEAEKEKDVPRETSQDDEHAIMSSMIPGSNFYDQSDLLPAFRVRQDPLRTRFDKPADLWSFVETKGIAGTGHDDALLELIKHIKEKYSYDCSHIFTAENYRRLICPDLRADLPLEFRELSKDLIEDNFYILPHVFDRHMQSKLYQDCPDMFHRVVTLFRSAPRGISYQQDTGGYWYPPVMPMALDYSSYTKSQKTTESKFHRDATTSQLREIIYANRLTGVEVNGKSFSGLYFNIVLKRQIFWLAGTTALSREALEGMLPRFEKELLQNSKSPDYQRYQKKIKSGDFGETNLINWFKDLCFRYHHFGWYIDRLKSDDGMLFLPGLGASCDTSGAASGTIAYIPTPWGQTREMFFTEAQWKMYVKFKNTLMLNDIGQGSL